MIFFIIIPLLAFMLLAASLTFTVVSAVPAFRKLSITAPIGAFIVLPVIGTVLFVFWDIATTWKYTLLPINYLSLFLILMIIRG